MSTITPQKDPLLLGGHAFQSRFILGSGKFSLPLIQAVMQYGESEIATIALRRADADSPENILTIFRRALPCCPILLVHEPQKKQFELPAYPENWDAVIL